MPPQTIFSFLRCSSYSLGQLSSTLTAALLQLAADFKSNDYRRPLQPNTLESESMGPWDDTTEAAEWQRTVTARQPEDKKPKLASYQGVNFQNKSQGKGISQKDREIKMPQ